MTECPKVAIFVSREPPNVQDRYGNRYDPRFHSIPGEYDPENDPRFSDPRYDDPRNLPKYNNNRHKVPQDRYDSKYRYYERFPDRQRERLRDPNYDPRWDPLDLPAPGVLGGWLPELQVRGPRGIAQWIKHLPVTQAIQV